MSRRAYRSGVVVGVAVGLALLPSQAGLQTSQGGGPALPGQTSTLLPDGRALVIGGDDPQGPVDTVVLLDPRTGAASLLPALAQPRAWHTATVLPSGTVLVFGGLDAGGRPLAAPEILDPNMLTLTQGSAPGLTPRAHHTATLLTDGRVLIAGGTAGAGSVLAEAELWNPRTGEIQRITMTAARAAHNAILEPDGTVLLWGGTDAHGDPLASGDQFDPSPGFWSVAVLPGDASTRSPRLEASIPETGATDVSVESMIALRFSAPLRVDTVSADTIILSGPGGIEVIGVVAAEGGMLAFVTPAAPLTPGAQYTLSINGAEATDGVLLALTEVRFTTAGAATGGGASGGHSGTTVDRTAHQHHPAGTLATPGSSSETDEIEWTGEWRDGKPHSPWQDLTPLHAPPGVTALAGQVLRLNGEPLAGVTLEIGGRSVGTDRTGRFLLTQVPAGFQELEMDGSTANRPGRTYGTFSYGIEIAPNRTTVLPFTIWMPLLDMRHATPLPVPTPGEVVATTPLIPGLEVHVPANVILRTYDGPLTVIPLTRIPVDRPPFPLPPGTTFFFTPQGHGAEVQLPDSSPSPTGVRIILPNPDNLPPGTRVALTGYDYDRGGWYQYGWGTVSPDGSQIVPDPGVQFHRLTCAFPLGAPGNFPAPILDGELGADPVDLGTGLATVSKVDLVLPDVIPLVIERKFRPSGTSGWTFFTFQIYLVGDATTFSWADLVLADGARVHYTRISSGTDKESAVMEHSTTPTRFYKSRLAWNAARPGWDITFPNGLVYEIAPNGHTGPWGTDPGPLLTAVRDRAGNRLTITRDPFNTSLVRRITSPNGRWVDAIQDANRNFTQFRDNLGRTVSYTYDTNNRLTSVTDPAGGVTRYTYDAYNRLSTIQDPRGIVFVANLYNGYSNGRVVSQTQGDGTTYQLVYTLNGNGTVTQTDVTDRRGNVRRLTFNAAGYVLTDTRAFGTALAQTTTYVRDATSSLVTSMTDALGRRTDYTHDAMGNVLTVTRLAGTPEGVTTTFSYEPTFNRVTTITDPLNHTTTLGYDGVGNVTSITDPLGHQTTVTYNAAGQPLTITTPAGTTQLGYDQGDLATVIDPTGKTVTRFTDGGGRLIALTSPRGRPTRYDYDALNRLIRVTDSLGGLTQFGYDGNGNLLSVTDARSGVTSYAYDRMDRVTTHTDPLLRQGAYAYDASGNPRQLTDRKGQLTSRTYDALDRLSTVTYQDGSTTTYAWDASNRVIRITDSSSGTITRTYDGLDRLTQETTPQGTVSYTYDAASRRASMTVSGQVPVIYGYDAADRLTQITQGSAVVSIGYDGAGRRASLSLPNGIVTTYAYDAASRLTGLTYALGATVLGTLTYAYDAAGNQVQVGGAWARTALPQAVATATYDPANQQLSFGAQTLTYDANGNLTSDGVDTYTWNPRNQLVAINGGGVTASFAYDPLGRRRTRVVDGVSAQFRYDGVNPVEEIGASDTATLLTGLGIDEYLTRTDATGTRAFLTDVLGSTVALTDPSGVVETQYTYEPFGATATTGALDANPFQYTGRENDGTGLYFYRARYYSPRLHRFLSEDVVSEIGISRYSYARNTPLMGIDPDGLRTIIIHGGLGSSGPNGSSDSGGNPGLNRIAFRLAAAGEAVDVFNSGQTSKAIERAEQACAAGEPVHLVGHSLGGTAAIEVARALTGRNLVVNNLFTLDPFAPDPVIPSAISTTNFVQHGGLPFGSTLYGDAVANILVRDVSHFTITDDESVQGNIVGSILGTRKSCRRAS